MTTRNFIKFRLKNAFTKEQVPSNNSEDSSDPDVIFATIGEFGKWQMKMISLLVFFTFPCTFHLFLPTFTGMRTKFWCSAPGDLADVPVDVWINYSQPQGPCTVRDLPSDISVANIVSNTAQVLPTFHKCTEWTFDRSEVGDTFVSEWKLVCERQHLNNLADLVFLAGIGIGGAVGGFISDNYGRKRILMSMLTAQCILAVLIELVTSYIQYALVRLALGLVSVSIVFAAFVLTVELVGGIWEILAGVCIFFPIPLAYIIVTVVSMALKNWRDLQLSLSLLGWLLIPLWFVLPESPRWLISVGRLQEAKAILEKGAKYNNKELPADIDTILEEHTKSKSLQPQVSMLFTTPLRKTTSCLFIAWFGNTIGYYGLVLNIEHIAHTNLHIMSIILALVEIPAILICIPILLRAGRRLPVFISMLVCGLACIATELFTLIYSKTWILITCLIIGKFSIGATNLMLPIYTAELYPTIIRNFGVGGTQVSVGLALACVPFLWNLAHLNAHLPLLMLAVLCIVGGAVILYLPDTRISGMHASKTNVGGTHGKTISSHSKTLTITDDREQK